MKTERLNLMMACLLVASIFLAQSCKKDDTPLPTPAIVSFTPAAGGITGTPVIITGTNFDAVAANNVVKFNGTLAVVTLASATSLTTSVPQGATTGKITVTAHTHTATSAADFTVFGTPTVTLLNPANGLEGATVTITGTNFDPIIENNVVKFNGTIATVNSANATTLIAKVPIGATTGPVTVTVHTLTATSATNFALIPTILSLNTTHGGVGADVIITGKNFDAVAANNVVKFNGTLATVTQASVTSLTTKVPQGATTGPITVTVNTLTATSANFTLDPPSINLSVNTGAIGKSITITATNFSFDITPAHNVVDFNGTAAKVSTATATQLTVSAPYGATSGTVHVKVNSNATILSPSAFTIVSAWTQKADMPVAHDNGFAFALNSVVHLGDSVGYFGGPNVAGQDNVSFYKYNQANDSWAQLNDLPETFGSYGFAFAIGKIGYGGHNSFYSYSAANDQWAVSSASVPGISSSESNFFTINNKSYAVDPAYGTWEFDPTGNNNQGTWTQLPASNNYPAGINNLYQKAFVVGGNAYLAGGYNGNNSMNILYKFTPGSGWITLNNLPAPATGYVDMFSIGQYGYLIYGTKFWRYDPTNDSWLQLEDVADKGTDITYFNVGLRTYLIRGGGSKQVWEYDPSK